MKKRFLRLSCLLSLCCGSFAAELPDYVRYREDAAGARLEVAIRTLALPSGQKVDLIGVVHIADDSYYRLLNQRFTKYDSVLFELVGDPEALTARAPAPRDANGYQPGSGVVGMLQQSASKHLNLTFQLDAIDYTARNMVHADLSFEELDALQRERGETMLTLFARAMQAQMNGQMSGQANAAMREFDTLGLIRILLSPDSAQAFKKSLARVFDEMEAMTAAMEGNSASAILGGRNDAAVKKVKEVLARKKQRHIAVFFGGAHMPGIETTLKKDLGATTSGEEWLAAWTMTNSPRADKTRAPGTTTPAS